jgi:hypothetical protein
MFNDKDYKTMNKILETLAIAVMHLARLLRKVGL